MNKWNGSRDIGGILRKSGNLHHSTQATTIPETESTRGADLLVFGYACKIFRDDEKALYIDQGKHLIPWMGDKTLKIDRYDVRGALSDLIHYEPPPGGYKNRLDYLTPAEQRAEQLCEEERYYSLYHNEEEEQMYKEEELKRLHQQGGGSATTSYGQVQFDYNKSLQKDESKTDNDEKMMEDAEEEYKVPPGLTIPENILKPTSMKLHAIIEKTAKFISSQGPQMEILIKAKQSNNSQFEFLNQSNPLNLYYKFVLNAFKTGIYPETISKQDNQQVPESTPPTAVVNSSNSVAMPDHTFTQPAIPIPTIKYRPSADCAYTQLISKIKGVPIQEITPDETASQIDYSAYYTTGEQETSSATATPNTQPAASQPRTAEVEVKKISSGLMLAQCYASDTEDENDSFENDTIPIVTNFPTPPESLQTIIDKTAIYVAKNGKQFEEILRSKDDERFTFLDVSNEYYPYYLHKVTGLNPNYRPTKSDKAKIIAPVSFSIKSKDDSTKSINPALLQETSDDEGGEQKTNSQNQSNDSNGAAQKTQTDVIVMPTPNALLAAATAAKINAAIASAQTANNSCQQQSKSRFDIDNTGAVVNRNLANAIVAISKGDNTQQKEQKRAEEKVKDRLAQIAREKLGLISKEKQLQLERKKRAMAFLNQIKGSGLSMTSTVSTSSLPSIENSTRLQSDQSSDFDSDSSIHSIPITIENNGNNNDSDREQDVHKNRKSLDRLKEEPIVIDHDDEEEKDDNDRRSLRGHKRHRSRSKSPRRHHKKKKSKHSKKKAKKRSRSRSSSPEREHKKSLSSSSKRSSSRKSKKRRKERDF